MVSESIILASVSRTESVPKEPPRKWSIFYVRGPASPVEVLSASLVEVESHIWRDSCRLRLECDGTRAKTRFRPSAKRTSPFKSAGSSVQSTAGNRGVRISDSNAVYTKFRGNVKSTGYPFASFPFTSPPVRHRVP